MEKMSVRDFFYKKNMKSVIITVTIFAAIFLLFINLEILRMTKDHILNDKNYYSSMIASKIKNIDYFIETLKNNTELKMFLDNDVVMLLNTKPIEIEKGEYYVKYTKRKINKYIFSEKIKKTVKWDDAMEFEIYSLDKKLIFSTANFEIGFKNFENIDTHNTFGNIYEYYIYNEKLYIRIFSKLNDDYLMIINYVINSDFVYELGKNQIKIAYLDDEDNPLIITKDINYKDVKVLFKLMENIKIAKIKNDYFIIFKEYINDFNNKNIASVLIFDKADILIRMIMVNFISIIIVVLFTYLLLNIMLKNYDFTISFIDNIKKIMDGEIGHSEKTNIIEYDQITENVAEYKKMKEEQESKILKEVEIKDNQITNIILKAERESKFLKKIAEKDDVRKILEISYKEFTKITNVTEIVFLMSMEGENVTKVLKVSEEGMSEDDQSYNVGDKALLSKIKGEEIMEIDGDGSGILILFFASDTIKNGFITINYEIENMDKKDDVKGQLIRLARLMISAMKSAKYYEMSIKDSLTGAYVKGILKHNIDSIINSSKRYQRTFAVLMLDIDFFKKINDNYGHLAGDYVLKEIGEIIRETVRDSDMFFRYGGEEFVILMPESDRNSAEKLAERIRIAIENTLFYCESYMEKPLKVTISIGGYNYIPGTEEIDYFEIMEFADKALYTAKKSGRNRVVF